MMNCEPSSMNQHQHYHHLHLHHHHQSSPTSPLPPPPPPPLSSTPREAMYKNKGMTSAEMRKRRETNTTQLRKEKRDFEINKRRNIIVEQRCSCAHDDDDDDHNHNDHSADDESMNDPIELFDESNLTRLFSNDTSDQQIALRLFRRHLCCDKGNMYLLDETLEFGLVDRFVWLLLNSSADSTRRDAIAILAAIVSGTSTHTRSVVESGVLPTFIQLLSSSDEEIRERSLLAIGNIAADQSAYRDLCLSLDVLPAILNVLDWSTKTTEIRSAVWCISNLCRGKNPPPDFSKVSTTLRALSKQLLSEDVSILGDACRAIASLSEGENAHIEMVVQCNEVVKRLVQLLLHANTTISTNALRAIGNIVTGTDQQTQVVLNCSVLESLEKLLVSGNEAIKKEVCWILSNILAGNRKQIQAVLDAQILPSLIHVLASGDFKTRKEACWAIDNALKGGNASQVAAVVKQGAILPLCDLLTVMEPKIVNVALNALNNILAHGELIKHKSKTGLNPYCALVEEARGLEKLEFLQQSPNLKIYVKAFDMIENYFAGDEVEELSAFDATTTTTTTTTDETFSF